MVDKRDEGVIFTNSIQNLLLCQFLHLLIHQTNKYRSKDLAYYCGYQTKYSRDLKSIYFILWKCAKISDVMEIARQSETVCTTIQTQSLSIPKVLFKPVNNVSKCKALYCGHSVNIFPLRCFPGNVTIQFAAKVNKHSIHQTRQSPNINVSDKIIHRIM